MLVVYSQISDCCQRKNVFGIINMLNRVTYAAVHQHNKSFNVFLMKTYVGVCESFNITMITEQHSE